MRDKSYTWIDNASGLNTLITELKAADTIAVDTEADSYHHYYEKVCLIQMSLAGGNYIIDPLAAISLSELMKVMTQKKLIFHDAGYDLRMLRACYGFSPCKEIFDTMLAAQLIGCDRIGLVELLRQFLGVEIYKKGQKSDWSKRPLSEEQISYAIDDTRYLIRLVELLENQLDRLGRVEWHRQCCNAAVQSSGVQKPPPDPEKIWRIKGASILQPGQLEFLRELWQWREHEAAKADLPPFKIMNNIQLLALAVRAQRHPGSPLTGGTRLPRNCTGRRLKNLHTHIQKAISTPQHLWPERLVAKGPKHFDPQAGKRAEAIAAECRNIAGRLNLAPQIIAPRAAIEAIAQKKPATLAEIISCSRLLPWQAELLAPAVYRIFEQK